MSGSSRSGFSENRCHCFALMMLILVGWENQAARAADIETRDFRVTVGSKSGGEVHMTIHRQDNGNVVVRCDTDIKVKLLVSSYKYSYRGVEVWKDRRLIRLDSSTDDNNKRFILSALATATGLRVKVNNVERTIKPECWVSSYWCLPDPTLRNQSLTILDADNGKDFSAKLQFVAAEKVRIGSQEVMLNHYKLNGKHPIDLWYDGSERLVRQEWVELGHKTVMELVRVRR